MKRTIFIAVMLSALASAAAFPFRSGSIGFGVGFYRPLLDYWNNESRISGWDEQFNGNLFLDANLKLKILSQFGLGLGAGFWNETVSQDNVWLGDQFGKETLTLRFIPVTLTGFYYPRQDFLPVQPYVGVGVGVNFIEKSVLREKSDQNEKDIDQGRDYLWLFSVGAERKLLPNLMADFQLRYTLGSYVQQVEEIQNEIVDKTVSVNGLQVLLSFGFLFR